MTLGRASLVAGLLLAPALQAQVRQLRAIPDPAFDASALDLSSPPSIRVNKENLVFVTDRESKRLYRLSANGRQSEVVVREGGGPGEALGFISLSWKGDTLWFFDNWQSRFSLHDSQGKFIRTLSATDRCSYMASTLMTGDSCLEFLQPRSQPTVDLRLATPYPVVLTSQQKKRSDTLGFISQAHSVMQFVRSNGDMSFLMQPFSDDASIRSAFNGKAVLEIQSPAATAARPDSIRLRLWSSQRGWSSWSAIRYEPRPLEAHVIDSVISVLAERMKKGTGWVTIEALREQVYRPRFYPPVPVVLASGDDKILIKIVQGNGTPGADMWVELDERLSERAHIAVPSNFRPVEARDDLLWGYELDEDEVPYVVRYKLIRD